MEALVVVPIAKRLLIVVEPVIPKVEPPLFQIKLAEPAVLEAPVAYGIWFMESEPDSLLLKVNQSVA